MVGLRVEKLNFRVVTTVVDILTVLSFINDTNDVSIAEHIWL